MRTSSLHSSIKVQRNNARETSCISLSSLLHLECGCLQKPVRSARYLVSNGPCARSGREGWKWNSVQFHIGMWRTSFVPHWNSMSSHSERCKTAPKGSPHKCELGRCRFRPKEAVKSSWMLRVFLVTPKITSENVNRPYWKRKGCWETLLRYVSKSENVSLVAKTIELPVSLRVSVRQKKWENEKKNRSTKCNLVQTLVTSLK